LPIRPNAFGIRWQPREHLIDALIRVSDQPCAVSLLNGVIELARQFRGGGKRIGLDRGAQIP
jgi:hypothetical protein